MVFPYLKGLINTVNYFYLYSDLVLLGFICIVLYFHIRSITSLCFDHMKVCVAQSSAHEDIGTPGDQTRELNPAATTPRI